MLRKILEGIAAFVMVTGSMLFVAIGLVLAVLYYIAILVIPVALAAGLLYALFYILPHLVH